MSLNNTPSGERVHIGFFGLRNAGKSSVVNAVTAQKLSVVSDTLGTTTDPVKKAMELLPIGAVVIVDTPGIDDVGELGEQRVKRAIDTLSSTDIAVLVTESLGELAQAEQQLCSLFEKKNIPYIIAVNKVDMLDEVPNDDEKRVYISAKNGTGISSLKDRIAALSGKGESERKLLGDIISADDLIVLVTPIDASAPKGRLILPQQQMIREILDNHALTVVVAPEQLEKALQILNRKPHLVITDSQAFGAVSKIVPDDIMLTSFSILFARYKGELSAAVEGAAALKHLKDGDRVLISEGCTHHRQCGDIGTVKLPKWISEYCKKELIFDFTSGGDFPDDLSKYAVIVHCGACMLNRREMLSRAAFAKQNGVPMTNYGIAIAEIHGILARSLSPFPTVAKLL